mmetsp:Transcript_66338/g.192202  ORF Transcript_66338/g.192202 Transcript_66338/m.192202 type:complete len:632 (+) Transcript_66338:1265-3160(+)
MHRAVHPRGRRLVEAHRLAEENQVRSQRRGLRVRAADLPREGRLARRLSVDGERAPQRLREAGLQAAGVGLGRRHRLRKADPPPELLEQRGHWERDAARAGLQRRARGPRADLGHELGPDAVGAHAPGLRLARALGRELLRRGGLGGRRRRGVLRPRGRRVLRGGGPFAPARRQWLRLQHVERRPALVHEPVRDQRPGRDVAAGGDRPLHDPRQGHRDGAQRPRGAGDAGHRPAAGAAERDVPVEQHAFHRLRVEPLVLLRSVGMPRRRDQPRVLLLRRAAFQELHQPHDLAFAHGGPGDADDHEYHHDHSPADDDDDHDDGGGHDDKELEDRHVPVGPGGHRRGWRRGHVHLQQGQLDAAVDPRRGPRHHQEPPVPYGEHLRGPPRRLQLQGAPALDLQPRHWPNHQARGHLPGGGAGRGRGRRRRGEVHRAPGAVQRGQRKPALERRLLGAPRSGARRERQRRVPVGPVRGAVHGRLQLLCRPRRCAHFDRRPHGAGELNGLLGDVRIRRALRGDRGRAGPRPGPLLAPSAHQGRLVPAEHLARHVAEGRPRPADNVAADDDDHHDHDRDHDHDDARHDDDDDDDYTGLRDPQLLRRLPVGAAGQGEPRPHRGGGLQDGRPEAALGVHC